MKFTRYPQKVDRRKIGKIKSSFVFMGNTNLMTSTDQVYIIVQYHVSGVVSVVKSIKVVFLPDLFWRIPKKHHLQILIFHEFLGVHIYYTVNEHPITNSSTILNYSEIGPLPIRKNVV